MSNAAAAAPAALCLSRILVPVDFSDACRRSAETARELARHFEGSIALLHAAAPVVLSSSVPEALAYCPPAEFTRRDDSERAALLESLLPGAGPPARRVMVEDDPAPAIVEYARQNRCDLIVMPTHGYGALQRLVLGSVTADVLRSAPCPVWTGRHCEAVPESFRTVVCALDLAHESGIVLRWAAGFARSYGASLMAVHVIPKSEVRAGGMAFDPDWHLSVARRARERITDLLRDAGSSGEISIEVGDVPRAIVDATKELAGDLLVIGRGPHSYAIIRAAPCPVVSV